MGDSDDSDVENGVLPQPVVRTSHEAKLRELLHNVISIEIKLCSAATKEFIRLLKGDYGRELLHLYIQTSRNCTELLEAWKVRQGKPGLSYVLSLISAILSHLDGKYIPDDTSRMAISRVLDKFARLLIEEKMDDVNKELVSKEAKRQKAALSLMASIVRRGSGMAAEVAKKFDFKLPAFFKLAEYKRKQTEKKLKNSTRKSFVGFAMSFLEVGKPGLLRWVLQQKEMYSGVFRGLGNDHDETIIYVLSTLQDRILVAESLVPPGLRSVLFGSVTLEQLVSISGRDDGGPAAEMAHSVLLMVCTDPCNGLMPDLKRHPNPLRGNLKRLLDLMKKLKATEIGYHRDLLLAIVKGRPAFASAYMDEFPYSLEDHASPSWFATVSLAANLVSTVGAGISFDFLICHVHDPPSFDSLDMQNIMKCICPRPFSRLVSNKGLLHSDLLVKSGTLRLLLEALKLLDAFIGAFNHNSHSNNKTMQGWASLKQEVLNEVRTFLSDPQVLLTQLSSLSSQSRSHELPMKRTAELEHSPVHSSSRRKKLKTDVKNDDTDIVIGGLNATQEVVSSDNTNKVVGMLETEELDSGKDHVSVLAEIWGFDQSSESFSTLEDADIYFHSKLLNALQIYLRTMPTVLEGSFEFFVNLLGNPLALPSSLQHSLLSLLTEYIGWSPRSGVPIKSPPLMYKHLHQFINLLILSPVHDIKHQAYVLARASMLSTGAFDRNIHEISSWFLFLPGYRIDKSFLDNQVLQSLATVLIPFLCEAISAVGNNLFKHWDIVRSHLYHLKEVKGFLADASPNFSPLIIRALQNCLKLLNSESGVFTVSQKTMISVYVCNTLKYILQIQMDARLPSDLIESILLPEKLLGSEDLPCEWRPLKNLLHFSQSILHERTCISLSDAKTGTADSSFADTLSEVERLVKNECGCELGEVTKAFSSSMVCTTPADILKNFPSVVIISRNLGVPVSILSSTFSLEQSLFAGVSKLWPKIFIPGLEMTLSMFHSDSKRDDTFGASLHSLHDETICDKKFDASEAVDAFSYFLKQTPFHVLFPAVVGIGSPCSLEPSKIQELLVAKLSEWTTDCLISYLRLVLFWIHQIRSYYIQYPLLELEQLSAICFTLVDHVLAQLLGLKPGSDGVSNSGVLLSVQDVQEVAETIFSHPVVITSLTRPLNCNEELAESTIDYSLETLLNLSRQRVHKLDHLILDMLKTTSGYLSSWSGQHNKPNVEDIGNKQLKPFNALVQRLFAELRGRFVLCGEVKDLMAILPTFYAVHALVRFISPFELLKLVNWMIRTVDVNDLAVWRSCKISALSIGFFIAGGAFRVLSGYMQQQLTERLSFNMFGGMDHSFFSSEIIEEVYVEVFKFATSLELDSAYECLLEAVNAVYRQKCVPHHDIHPLSLVMLRVVSSTPLEILSHCIHKTSVAKAKLLSLLTEVSSLHLSVSGHLLLSSMKKSLRPQGDFVEEMCSHGSSDEDFMMLLPAALSYLNSIFMKFGRQYYEQVREIPSFYSSILLKGFAHWRSFVSEDKFQEEYGEILPLSGEELLNLFHDSLLGKSIRMLQYHFYFSGDSMKKKRLKLFNSIIPCSVTSAGLLDCDISEVDSYSLSQSLNLINRVVAKVSLCRILLFPEDSQFHYLSSEPDQKLKELSVENGSNKEASSRMSFVNLLVTTWHNIVKKYLLNPDSYRKEKSTSSLSLYKYLETYIMKSIFGIVLQMHDNLIELQSIPFLEQLMRLSLLYRFEDPMTLKMLQRILILLSDGKFSRIPYLQLQLAHSQFAPTILSISKSSGGCQIGAFLRPMSSILRSLIIPCPIESAIDSVNNLEITESFKKQLEVIKLLRILFQFKAQSVFDSEEDVGINSKELLALLLSSYGATLREIDLEIYNLMHEIESIDGSDSEKLAEMDYLWGDAALKIREVRALEKVSSSNVGIDTEAIEERRRSQFRENLPVDPKICASTVLNFPYDRTTKIAQSLHNKLESDNIMDISEVHPCDVGNMQRYDPVFILRFSIHCLSVGYIEPVEFAGLGLLAVAFISLSSPDEGIRKLSYECLGRFKNTLEKCRKRKDVLQLRLLLAYVQNGIEEAWQRIPSVAALFAAETSFILLDPSNDHYATLSKLLMHSSRMNTKCVPFFDNFFSSSSVNFKSERLWMLRLLFAGLNLDDDAHIYIRNSILEILLSFYVSPLSDNESNKLILQIVRKSVKLQKMTRYLVEQCGLFSWLSTVFSAFSGSISSGEKSFALTQIIVVLQVVNDVILSRNITEWLQKYALEQLMELSSQLHKFLIGSAKSFKGNVMVVRLILEVLISVLKISHKRKMYQPHLTLSVDGLYQLYEAVNVYDDAKSSCIADFGLKTILMSSPSESIFDMNPEKLSSFILWAIATALKSDSAQMLQHKESSLHLKVILEEELCEDFLVSKLLRWLTASVILRKFSWKSNDMDPNISKRKTLQSLLEHIRNTHGERSKNRFGSEEVVAAAIFYLQQALGMSCGVLRSAVSALCLLLCDSPKLPELSCDGNLVASLCSNIELPAEANPAWRWSFYQPWKDLSSLDKTDSQKMDEFHACQTLSVIISDLLRSNRTLNFTVLTSQDVERYNLCKTSTE